MSYWWGVLAGCSSDGREARPRDPVVLTPDTSETAADGCPGVSPLDWVDGIDEDGDGVTDRMVVAPGDGWDIALSGASYGYHDRPSVGGTSVSVDVERDGRVDWFVASVRREPWGPITELEGLIRIDDVRDTCATDLHASAPFLSLPALAQVDLWEDTTGDGVPELLVMAQERDDGGDPQALDLYLLDPTTTGHAASIVDLAIGHLAVAHGDAGTVADFDGDGRPEVVYADLDRDVLVFLGALPRDGDPVTPDAEVATPENVDWLGYTPAGDVNGDGAADLALTYFLHGSWTDDDSEYYLGTRHARVIYGGPDLGAVPLDEAFKIAMDDEGQVLVADFDGDGFDDLATGNDVVVRGAGAVPLHLSFLHGSPAGLPDAPDSELTLPLKGATAVAGDVDGGGIPDLLLANFNVEEITGPDGTTSEVPSQGAVLYRGEVGFAAPVLALAVGTEPGWGDAGDFATWGLADVDLDGHADVLARDLAFRDGYGAFVENSIDVLWGEPLP